MNSKNITLIVSIIAVLFAIPSVLAANVLLQWQNAPNDYQYTIQEGQSVSFYYNANVYDNGFYTIKLYNANGDIVSTVKENHSMSKGESGFYTIAPSNYGTYGTFTLKLFAQDPSSSETYKLGLTVLCKDLNKNGICDDQEKFTSIDVKATPNHGTTPLQVQFTCKATGGSAPISYAWTFGDGKTSVSQNPSHIYENKGSYTAMCTAKDSLNTTISGTASVIVTDYINLAPVANFTAIPTSGYAPLLVYFDGSSSYDPDGIIIMYAWDIDGSIHFAQGETAQYNFTKPGIYNVTLTVVDDDEATSTITKQITVLERPNHAPVIHLPDEVTIYERTNNMQLLTVTDADGDDIDDLLIAAYPYDWPTWVNPMKNESANNTWNIYMRPGDSTAGTYLMKFTVYDPQGAKADKEFTIHVLHKNQAPIIDAIPNITVYEGELVNFTVHATDPENDSLTYSISDLRYTQNNNVFTWQTSFGDAGKYGARVRVSDGNLTSSTSVYVTVLYKNHAPTADFTIAPNPAMINEQVLFDASLSSDPDADALTYAWDFGDGATGTGKTAHHAFTEKGTFTITLTVSDGEFSDTVQKTILVENKISVDGIACIPEIVAGHLQSCGVKVVDASGPSDNTIVDVHYLDGTYFGSCTTDRQGSCRAEAIVENVGNYTVYANAQKPGYINDTDTYPRDDFIVYKERYDIDDLRVYNDSNFMNEDYDFFRGENLYVKFRVKELHTETYVMDDIVAKALLVSKGYETAELTKIGMEGDYFLFKLTPIPLKHDFIGPSQIFTFAFNYADGSGGQKEVGVMIRNNPPKIQPEIPDAELVVGDALYYDLALHEFDLEDSGENLTWSYTQSGTSVNTHLDGKVVYMNAVAPGTTDITVTLADWDGDIAQQTFTVTVNARPENNTAPMVMITKPSTGDIFYEDATILFEGHAHDKEDGDLMPKWHSSLDGDLGMGNSILKQLSLGTHIITLSAVDSKGLEGKDSITIVVIKKQVSEITAELGGPYYAWPKTTITLDASKSTGPIHYYSFDFGDGSSITQTTAYAQHIYDGAKDSYTVVLTVTGDDNQTATDTATVFMKKEATKPVEDRVGNDLYIGTINVYGYATRQDYTIGPNEDLVVDMGIENDADQDFSGLTATIIIPELGIKQTTGSFRLDQGETTSKSLIIPMVATSPGEYYMKIIVGNGRTIRVKYRYFTVE
jgi:PKD repeat protein